MILRFLRRLRGANRPFRLTPAGWVFILYTIGVGAGAINTGNNLLYLVFGLFLGMILASGVLSDLSLWDLGADWVFPRACAANEPVFVPLTLSNGKKKISSIGIAAEMSGRLNGRPVRFRVFVPLVKPGERSATSLVWVPPSRGRFQMEAVAFSTRFPFGLLSKSWLHAPGDAGTETSRGERGFFVFPEPVEITADLMRLAMGTQRQADPLDRRGDGTTLFGVRDFHSGDNPRRIDWKASAKRGSTAGGGTPWLVREMEAERSDDVTLAWPPAEALAEFPEDQRELFVRFAASAVRVYRDAGKTVRLRVPDIRDFGRALDVHDRPGIDSPVLEFLAIVDPLRPAAGEAVQFLAAPLERKGAPAPVDLLGAFRQWAPAKAAS